MRTEARGHSAYYFFIVIVIRYETTATARWALPLIVHTLFNDAITVAVWTCFHVCLPANTSASLDASSVLSTGYFAATHGLGMFVAGKTGHAGSLVFGSRLVFTW